MKVYSPAQIRNIAIIGHGSSGKTSLAEAMLFTAKATTRLGKVDEGNSISDFSSEEVKRKISISLSLLHCDWNDTKLNILDLPGYADFVGEVTAGLRAVENAVLVISALAGVEVGSDQYWKIATRNGCAAFILINKLDKEHAKFYQNLDSLQKHFGRGVAAVQIPIGEGLDFKGIIDLINMRAFIFEKDGRPKEAEIPEDNKAQAEKYRAELIESISEVDDALLEKFLEKGELTPEEIKSGLKIGIAQRKIFPVLCGAATQNWGAYNLLNLLAEFAPSPVERAEFAGTDPVSGNGSKRKVSNSEPVVSFIFKTLAEPHLGELSYFKCLAGRVSHGEELLNPGRQITERVGQIYLINGKERTEVPFVEAGDIGAFVKLKNSHTGDTLCDKKHPIQSEAIVFPKPVIGLAIKPVHKGEEEKIAHGLSKLHEEDPTFLMHVDADIKQTLIHGQGELHLEIMVSKLKEKFGVGVELEDPRIPYRETIKGRVEVQGKYKRQSGGRGQYGDVWLKIEPRPHGAGFEFVNAIVGGAIPSKYVPSVEEGITEAMQEGILAGYPVVDLKVTLYDGSFHTVDSSDMAFKIAGSMGFKKGAAEANPVLLEPIYDVEVTVPGEYMGSVMGDVSSRRGKIMGMEAEGSFEKIKARVPLAELNKYSTSLRSMTQGRGFHSRSFYHYEEVPKEISERIVKATLEAKEKAKQA
ncbi:MAG: elongation factor G [candidate division Zixibacteria bacterium]|nr:elongation factor G [candidate division Zixibacteria bacterium]